MEQVEKRLDEWGKHSDSVKRITEHLKQNLNPVITEAVMNKEKSAQKLWDHIVQKAAEALNNRAGILSDDQVYAFTRSYLLEPVDDKAEEQRCSEITTDYSAPKGRKASPSKRQVAKQVKECTPQPSGQYTLF